jgi:hypothetical protein
MVRNGSLKDKMSLLLQVRLGRLGVELNRYSLENQRYMKNFPKNPEIGTPLALLQV